LTALGRLWSGVREATLTEPDDEAMAAVDELFPTGFDRIVYTMRSSALIVLSSSIAAFGLLANSAGVVIGAMLVAPLMTPILATAAAMVRAMNRELLTAVATILLGTVLAIVIGFIVSLIASETIVGPVDLPGEVEARTFPGLLDPGIAITAGYILPRRSTKSALPGVGIAVAWSRHWWWWASPSRRTPIRVGQRPVAFRHQPGRHRVLHGLHVAPRRIPAPCPWVPTNRRRCGPWPRRPSVASVVRSSSNSAMPRISASR
jgi:hypothetical protein